MKTWSTAGKTNPALRLASILALSVMATSAWAGHRMIIHNLTHQLANGFVTTYELPQPAGWYVSADQFGQLIQPTILVQTFDDQSAGTNSVTLKNAKGKTVAEVEDKGILGAIFLHSNYESFVAMFIKGGASDAVGPVFDTGRGFKSREVTMSPPTFGKGSQLILKFAGHLPEQTTTLIMNATLWGDQTQITNVPNNSLGQVMYDEPGIAGGGQATITIDFELVDE